jgi:phage terminase Nu1 subunit (DNA packaging protein)
MKNSIRLSNQKPDLSALEEVLPPFVARNHPRFQELIGYSPRTIANLDSQGLGVPERIMLGNVVAYPRHALISWLEARSRVFA